MSGLAERCNCGQGGEIKQGEAVVVKHSALFALIQRHCGHPASREAGLQGEKLSGLYNFSEGCYCSHDKLVNWHH